VGWIKHALDWLPGGGYGQVGPGQARQRTRPKVPRMDKMDGTSGFSKTGPMNKWADSEGDSGRTRS
jgi:hypothetical protein